VRTFYLDLEDLLVLAGDLGVGPVRDLGLLDSAVHRPMTCLFGDEAYPDLDTKAAALLESLVGNHPLVDGNKRLGWLATVVFYGLNGVTLDAPDDAAYDLVIGVATGRVGYPAAASLLSTWRTAGTADGSPGGVSPGSV
jgi:death on curing protein